MASNQKKGGTNAKTGAAPSGTKKAPHAKGAPAKTTGGRSAKTGK